MRQSWQDTKKERVGSKSHCRAVPAVPSPIWCASNLIFIISSKLAYEVKNCNDIMVYNVPLLENNKQNQYGYFKLTIYIYLKHDSL